MRLVSFGLSSFRRFQFNLLHSRIQLRNPRTADLAGADRFLLLSTRLSDYLRLADAPPKTRLRLPLLPLPASFQVADSWIPLEFQMKPNGGHKHRTAIAIVSGVGDMLQAWSNVNVAPDACGAIGLQDIFAAVVEPTIAYDEAVVSIGKVGLVVKRDTVARTNH